MNNNKKIELLSPVGNYESAISAIKAGADSIYVGALAGFYFRQLIPKVPTAESVMEDSRAYAAPGNSFDCHEARKYGIEVDQLKEKGI